MSKVYDKQRPLISSHTNFQPLKEAWLGDVYPDDFAEVIDPKYREFLHNISEKTRKDLQRLESKMQELGITVRRPEFNCIDEFLDEHDNLIKPPICPRDWALTLGDELHVIPQYPNKKTGFESTLALYESNKQNVNVLDRGEFDPMCYVVFPSVVRIGKDLLIDIPKNYSLSKFDTLFEKLSKHYRLHISRTGDHSDGVFCPVKPGWIFSTHYRTQYSKTFPEWNVFFLTDTTRSRSNGHNGKWWVPGMDYSHYNRAVLDIAKDWIGNSQETVFEVNMLVVDENNVICIAEDDLACKKLESIGITPHVINISTRGFWDGGIHCLTLDIYRQGNKLDYWPLRGNLGIYLY